MAIGCVYMLASGLGMIGSLGADIWACLCCLDILFLGFCYPVWFLEECGGFGLPGRESF